MTAVLPQTDKAMDTWLGVVRQRFESVSPELLPLFNTYAGEACFGRRYIDADLNRLPDGASVLEVGAGALLLSCQLVREGFAVTALEPIGQGFSHFSQMREIILAVATEEGCLPNIVNQTGETFAHQAQFSYAYSINVMEHVDDVASVVRNVMASLLPGARYRFTCPNYLFPYEPHFNIPTVLTKPLTEKLFYNAIFNTSTVTDPVGTWASLNWINVWQVSRIAKALPGVTVGFNRGMLASTLARMVSDPSFAGRRSPWMRAVLGAVVRCKLHKAAVLVPLCCQPLMDCTFTQHSGGADA